MWRALSATSPKTSDEVPDAAMGEAMQHALAAPIQKLVTSLSFSHLAELIAIVDPLKRAFYEIECIRGNWAVRAQRSLASLEMGTLPCQPSPHLMPCKRPMRTPYPVVIWILLSSSRLASIAP
jgi:hypothetical protein